MFLGQAALCVREGRSKAAVESAMCSSSWQSASSTIRLHSMVRFLRQLVQPTLRPLQLVQLQVFSH